MHSWFEGQTSASSGEAIDVDGSGWTASLEAGYPLALSANWTLEPQAQLLWQPAKLDDRADSFSTNDFATGDVLTGRPGLRPHGEHGRFPPSLTATLRPGFAGNPQPRFGTAPT